MFAIHYVQRRYCEFTTATIETKKIITFRFVIEDYSFEEMAVMALMCGLVNCNWAAARHVQ